MNRILLIVVFISSSCLAQNKQDVIQKVNNAASKATNVIAVFQPYLLKARQLFFDARQMGADIKNDAKNTFPKKNKTTNNGMNNAIVTTNNSTQTFTTDTSNNNNQLGNNNQNQILNNSSNNNSTNNNNALNNNNSNTSQNNQLANNSNPQTYLVNQSLPINNDASVNNDGTGNWGNQNNGLYGNCLDALTGTVMGMGEAADKPTSVDLMFFAPADGQNTYYLLTPGFARNNSSVSYWTEHTSDQVMQWNDVNETEVALTKLTLGQFDQIQNNNQIQNAVRNAQNYAGYYTSVEKKLDGQVFAIKAELDNRQVYALVAVIKQIGTSGSNGYLKIKIKAQGIDGNGNGQVTTNSYLR